MKPPAHFVDWIRIHHLYYKAFPSSERKPLSIIRSMYKKGRSDVWLYYHQGKFAGFASTVNGDRCILLDYLAIVPAMRSQGAGSAFLQEINQHYQDCALFVEIEYADGDCADTDVIQRRKQFYLRNGMTEFRTYAQVFGVRMELLGYRCHLDFSAYRHFYRDHYSPWAADHIVELPSRSQ